MYHDDSSDNGGGHGTWIRKPKPLAALEEKPKLKVHIESAEPRSSPASGEKSTGSTMTLMASSAFPGSKVNSNGSTKIGGLTEMLMKQKENEAERKVESEQEREKVKATSPTIADDEDGWAMRPPPEAVYERLERYFGNHDLDKPVIEATSGGTSPTSTEPVAPPQVIPSSHDKEREKDKIKMRAKKSIRYVAEDAKRRIDRTSKADPTYSTSYLKKRSTKFWGGRLEEVTTHQAKSNSISVAPGTSPESSSNGETSKC
jgi:mitogen-activated protein kinase kinase kinase